MKVEGNTAKQGGGAPHTRVHPTLPTARPAQRLHQNPALRDTRQPEPVSMHRQGATSPVHPPESTARYAHNLARTFARPHRRRSLHVPVLQPGHPHPQSQATTRTRTTFTASRTPGLILSEKQNVAPSRETSAHVGHDLHQGHSHNRYPHNLKSIPPYEHPTSVGLTYRTTSSPHLRNTIPCPIAPRTGLAQQGA